MFVAAAQQKPSSYASGAKRPIVLNHTLYWPRRPNHVGSNLRDAEFTQ